jgi:glycosyltransferase involved in cell wall biosynthesis
VKISALIPVRNGVKYLHNLQKDLISNFPAIDQIVFVNDGSEDGTEEFISNWAKFENRIQLINTSGLGLVSALNIGLVECQGDWIARFDVDDRYSSHRIIEQIKYIDRNVGAIFSDYEFMSSNERYLGYVPSGVTSSVVSISLVNSQRTAHPSALIRKEALIEVGGYRKMDFPVEDLSLWLRLSRHFNLVSSPKSLIKYRLTKNSITRHNKAAIENKRIEILREFPVMFSDYNSSIENFLSTVDLYESLPHVQLRLQMLFKDILEFEKVNEIDRKSSILLNHFFKNILKKHELIGPVYYKIIRDIYRFL